MSWGETPPKRRNGSLAAGPSAKVARRARRVPPFAPDFPAFAARSSKIQ